MTAQIHHIHRKPRLVEPPRDYAEQVADYIAAVEADLREQDRVASVIAETRKYRWQQRVKWGAIAVGYLTVLYFCFQMGRGL